jgi:single-stranded-DNA-specific exonuclease
LTGENRLLVRAGLEQINTSPRPGVSALMRAAGVKTGGVDAGKIGFTLAPRLNAAGRLESAEAAYQLLTAVDVSRADDLAGQLNHQNDQRQTVTAQVARAAETLALETDADAPLLFAAHDDYNAGVIGLAAARLVEKHYRPAVVVAIRNGEARGSCRSVKGFHITDALDQCADLLSKHGGHAAAAGFTLPAERVADLSQRLREIAGKAQPPGGWRRVIKADAEIPLGDLDFKALRELSQLEPHGIDNPRPVFVARGAELIQARRVGKADGAAPPHLQLKLRDVRRTVWEAVSWRAGERIGELSAGMPVDLAFHLDANEWNGERKLQLVVQDFGVPDGR